MLAICVYAYPAVVYVFFMNNSGNLALPMLSGLIECREISAICSLMHLSWLSSLIRQSSTVIQLVNVVPICLLQSSGWRKIRNIVQWTPFFQTYKKQRYPWVQLAGHQGNFKAGPEPGTVLKKLCPKEEECFQVLMQDVLRPYVPVYKGQVTSEEGERKKED